MAIDSEIGSGPCLSEGKHPLRPADARERNRSMRRFPSKLRVGLLVACVAAVVLIASSSSVWAQGTPAPAAPGTPPPPQKQSLMGLILSHPDFVSFTIAILSIIGLTLIIQGFIKIR